MMTDNTRRAELVSKIITKRSRILEIGSGHGFFLDIMKKNGYDITGSEISKEKRKYSKKVTKVPVLDININEKIPITKSFDIVVLFHVLEHITDPVILLKNIKKLLKPKGKVLVEVPNCDDFHLGLNKFYKEFYWQRAHIHYFNPKSLKTMINLGGFKSIKITGVQRYSIENFFNWILTNKPQIENPTFSLSSELNRIDESWKKYLERNLICDTLRTHGRTNQRIALAPVTKNLFRRKEQSLNRSQKMTMYQTRISTSKVLRSHLIYLRVNQTVSIKTPLKV